MTTTNLKKSDFYYDLPPELIAQTPATPRDSSRLLYLDRAKDTVQHLIFKDILDILKKGDVLVINNTKVIPARLAAYDDKGREYEALLLKRIDYNTWEALLKPAKKAKIGSRLVVNGMLSFDILAINDNGVRTIRFIFDSVFEDILAQVGSVPLPPYITKKLEDAGRYQTVYAQTEGSSAAPTAGLHFTPRLLADLQERGIEVVQILLHVGLGTFRPVKEESIADHKMHYEYYSVSQDAANQINKAKAEGRRVIAVGTTSVRTLESVADGNGKISASSGETGIFIYPPYNFKVIDGMITNFHLPESTLIMLVSAFAGHQRTLQLYRLAVQERYRFFSFGDAMIII